MRLRDELNGYLRLPRGFFGIPPQKSGLPDVGVLGIPYDLTSSYHPGCRFGPDALRQSTDSERSHSYPLTIGSTDTIDAKSLSKLITLEDVGDLEVMTRLPEAAFYDISEATTKLARHECNLLFIGGDHFITYPILRGLKRGHLGNVGLIYLDAHADFYEDMGGYQFSHATTLRRITQDGIVKIENIIAHDLRTAPPDQIDALKSEHAAVCSPETFTDDVDRISRTTDWLYLSVDLDVLRPEIVPGIGHPESGGLDVTELVSFINIVFDSGKVRYADVVELNPLTDVTGLSSIAARDVTKCILTGFASQKQKK